MSEPRPISQPPGGSLAAVFEGAGRPMALREIPVPELLCREVLVRIDCCTICGSDLHTVTGKRQEAVPSILGHEALGVVRAVGEPPLCDIDGHPLEVGDRVTWSTAVSCGACDRCRGGLPQKCRTLAKYGHSLALGREALSGGLAEFILLRPGSAVVKLGPEIPDAVVCPANCATATVAAAYRTAGETAGRRVLILGAGLLGLTAAAMAKFQEASLIAVCDGNVGRLSRAKQFGADASVEWHSDEKEFRRRLAQATGTEAFDLILELSGSPEAVEVACRAGNVGARIVLVGSVMKSRPVLLDPERIVRQWITLQGIHNYAPEDLRTAVGFLSLCHARFPFAELVESTFSLSDVNQAIEFAIHNRPVRVAIRP